jgi:hypothetical protein
MRERLKRELELRSDDDARQAVQQYRRVINDLERAAVARFDLQRTILERAASWGLQAVVWPIVSARSSATELSGQEPYLTTSLSGTLLAEFQSSGDEDAVRTLQAAVAAVAPRMTVRPPVAAQFGALVAAGKYREAAQALNHPELPPDQREALLVETAAEFGQQGKWAQAWSFVSSLPDLPMREQCYEACGWIGTRAGQAEEVQRQQGAVSSATEKVALGRGLVAGSVEASRP